MPRAPSLFISHGSPMFALEPGLLGPKLQGLGAMLTAISAIVVVSPHWQTRGSSSAWTRGALALPSVGRVGRKAR